jgi:integrase
LACITDREELKPDLIIFRRSDVQHLPGQVPKADRQTVVPLKTSDINAARGLAWDQDGAVRYAIKIGHPIFNRPSREVAKEYCAVHEVRAKRGATTKRRVRMIAMVLN